MVFKKKGKTTDFGDYYRTPEEHEGYVMVS